MKSGGVVVQVCRFEVGSGARTLQIRWIRMDYQVDGSEV